MFLFTDRYNSTKRIFLLLWKMLTNFGMQVSAVITIETAVFLHYGRDQQAQS